MTQQDKETLFAMLMEVYSLFDIFNPEQVKTLESDEPFTYKEGFRKLAKEWNINCTDDEILEKIEHHYDIN